MFHSIDKSRLTLISTCFALVTSTAWAQTPVIGGDGPSNSTKMNCSQDEELVDGRCKKIKTTNYTLTNGYQGASNGADRVHGAEVTFKRSSYQNADIYEYERNPACGQPGLKNQLACQLASTVRTKKVTTIHSPNTLELSVGRVQGERGSALTWGGRARVDGLSGIRGQIGNKVRATSVFEASLQSEPSTYSGELIPLAIRLSDMGRRAYIEPGFGAGFLNEQIFDADGKRKVIAGKSGIVMRMNAGARIGQHATFEASHTLAPNSGGFNRTSAQLLVPVNGRLTLSASAVYDRPGVAKDAVAGTEKSKITTIKAGARIAVGGR